jgi:sugar phosphate permease
VHIGSSQVAIQAILAHEGGWDEFMLVSGPIVVIIGLLVLAKRRVDAIAPDGTKPPSEPTKPTKSSK